MTLLTVVNTVLLALLLVILLVNSLVSGRSGADVHPVQTDARSANADAASIAKGLDQIRDAIKGLPGETKKSDR